MPVLPGPCYILSDAHLGIAPPATERALLAFLRHARHDAKSVVINGDLFDFWFEWKHVMPRAGFRVLAALAEFSDAGIPVLWIGGNHDGWGGDILRSDAGVDFQLGAWQGVLAGWRARFEHGDGLRPVEDKRYRALRVVLRNRVAIGAFRWLHPDLGARLALGSSHASRTYKAKDNGEGLRAVGVAALAADPTLDLLVYGHSHVAALERTPTRNVYANPGTWLDDTTYLRVASDEIALCRWAEAEGRVITALPRQ